MNSASIINLQYTTIKDPLPDFIYKGLKNYSSNANIYQPQPQVLLDKLAKKHRLPKSMIYLTAGADEAIQMFALTFGKNAYIFTPTYVVYTDVCEFGGKLNKIFSISDDQYKIISRKIKDASLIYLANPNNPCGFTPKEQVMELIKNNSQSIVIIDEAYGEFANLSVINQVKSFKNMAVLKSFSKSYCMAGNRIGYIIANPKIIEKVKNKTQWANVSYLSVGAAVMALEHEDYFEKIRVGIKKRREDLASFLKKLGFRVLPSLINAVLIKFDSKAEGTRFVNFLNQNNIIVSHSNGNSNVGLDESFVRISIGNKKQLSKLQKTISHYKK